LAPTKRNEEVDRISRADIDWAIEQVNAQNWIPKRRNSTKYSLRHENRGYPLKYLVMLAGNIPPARRWRRATSREANTTATECFVKLDSARTT
jgi:hypothetical protein